MSHFRGFGRASLFALAIVSLTAGCHSNPAPVPADTNQAGTQNPASDPSTANLAPVVLDSSAQLTPTSSGQENAPAPPTSSAQQSPPPTDQGNPSYQSSGQYSDDPGYGQQPVTYAPQPPPPLPQYEQPQAPGDGYLWTPGYWAWSPQGYYWVPGAWVEAPYEDALWTPGYWGFWHNRYGFYRGYWGRHIGYYGGIDYGFGYIGFGYQGGYWGGGHFNYNRSVNNVNITSVHNIYNHTVIENNRGGDRVSFNGGSGGIQVRARPAELAGLHEQHAPPMRAQLENERAASTNRAQFESVNHGRPASVAVSLPLAADRNVRAPIAQPQREMQQRQAAQPQHEMQQRQAAQPQREMQQQQRQEAPQQRQMQQQQREAAPQQRQMQQQQREAAPRREAVPQQRQAAPQREAAPKREEEQHPK